MDFDFDAGTMAIWSAGKSLHTWRQFGFRIERQNRGGVVSLLAPHWFLAAMFGFLPLWSFAKLEAGWLRAARRRRRGACVKCGYDLRATPSVCPECNTAAAVVRSRIKRLHPLTGPLAAIAVAAILLGLLVCSSRFVWRKVNFNRWTLPTMEEYAAIAAPYQPIVQAIYDYRAEHGHLPSTLADLTPRYLRTIPDQAKWYGESLDISAGFENPLDRNISQLVFYSFRPNEEGWRTGGALAFGPLPLPQLASTRPSSNAEEMNAIRLSEFDQRIAASPADTHPRKGKICFLVSLGRTFDALRVCEEAAAACPSWWFPQMVLANLSPPVGGAAGARRLSAWADQHPTFLHYWCLARVCRDRGQDQDALAALERGAACSLEMEPDKGWNPIAIFYDAATYAYEQRHYQLAVTITRLWSTFPYPGGDVYALQSAAEFSLGQFDAAQSDADAAVREQQRQAIWTQHLDQLQQAVAARDASFVLETHNDFSWKLFPDANWVERY